MTSDIMDKQFCHFEGHLNSPITDDEVNFILNYETFTCLRHKRLKDLLNTQFKGILAYSEYEGCYWTLVEEIIVSCRLKVETNEPEFSLKILLEAACWNTKTHHESYYGELMELESELDIFREIIHEQEVQNLYRIKSKVETIKSQLTNTEQTLGEFHLISNSLIMERELTIVMKNGKHYLYPTSLVMCVLDNLQTRFYVRLHVSIKERTDGIKGLTNHYHRLHDTIVRLRHKYKNKFFEIMKNWDAYCIGVAVSDEIEDLGFVHLKNEIEEELMKSFDRHDVRSFTQFRG